ncbi:MAG: L-2-amino-thiazoline-4-carboxylic acid hydrolase [Candidatus Hodarchaeota archaeon]
MKKLICTYNENAKLSYKIRDVINPCLSALELFLKNIKTKRPDSFDRIIDILNTIYGNIENHNVSINLDYEILNHYPKILEGSLNHALSLVNYNKYKPNSIDEEIDIDAIDLVRTFTHFEYIFMSSLLEIMSREEAIEYVKKMTDELTHSRNDPSNYVESFQDILNRFQGNLGRWQMQTCVAEILGEERMLYLVKKCKWGEILKDFDLEFCYAMNCYQDFENTKNLNPNFILTRTKTILMGDVYCDFCYHDTRKEKEITHPSEKEFQELI